MGDVDYREPKLIPYAQDDIHNIFPASGVYGGERLVHEQGSGARQQSAANGNALCFAARQCAWPAAEQMFNPEKIDDRL